jgi:hypothetical protein
MRREKEAQDKHEAKKQASFRVAPPNDSSTPTAEVGQDQDAVTGEERQRDVSFLSDLLAAFQATTAGNDDGGRAGSPILEDPTSVTRLAALDGEVEETNDWACESCTYVNDGGRHCAICGSRRSRRRD